MIGKLPCDCWELRMPTEARMKPVLMCFWDGWLKEIETQDVYEAMRLRDALDAKYAEQTPHPFGLERDGTT